MLTITVPAKELYDAAKNEFSYSKETVLELEHSLAALSKWEEIYEKPFLTKEQKTTEQVLTYFKCMVVTPNVPPEVFLAFTQENMDAIAAYIEKPMTATWFKNLPAGRTSRETITAELIYYWMIGFQIPDHYDQWHINKLFTLIRVCNEKQEKPKKRPQQEVISEQARLNAERREKYGTSG